MLSISMTMHCTACFQYCAQCCVLAHFCIKTKHLLISLVLCAAGKSFFKKKKVPIPVNLQTKDWSAQIQKALSGTYLNKNGGNCLSIRYSIHLLAASAC